MKNRPPFDPERIPRPLRRFADFVRRWGQRMERVGRERREEDIERIQADPIAMAELTSFAKAFTKADWEAFDEWRDRTDCDNVREQDYFDWLNGLLHELDLWPEEEEEPTIDELIADLQRRGKLLMASKRANATEQIAKQHSNAQEAIPNLRRLLTDLDFRVRVWAHCALGRIVPDERKKHRTSIQAIRQACIEESNAVSLGDGECGSRARHKVVCSLILDIADEALEVLDD